MEGAAWGQGRERFGDGGKRGSWLRGRGGNGLGVGDRGTGLGVGG